MKRSESKTWPNEVRREMIEKSKIYGEEYDDYYHFGYYDGFQKAIEYFNITLK